MVEQFAVNEKVLGSSPSRGAEKRTLSQGRVLLFFSNDKVSREAKSLKFPKETNVKKTISRVEAVFDLAGEHKKAKLTLGFFVSISFERALAGGVESEDSEGIEGRIYSL